MLVFRPNHAPEHPRQPAANASSRDHAPDHDGFLFSRDQPNPLHPDDAEPAAPLPAPSPPPWREETAARDRVRSDLPAPAAAEPAVKPRRNLLFSSSLRKERERSEARTTDPSLHPAPGGRAAQIQRSAARDIRGQLAATGTPKGRRSAAAATQRPHAIDVYPGKPCRTWNRSLSAGRAT